MASLRAETPPSLPEETATAEKWEARPLFGTARSEGSNDLCHVMYGIILYYIMLYYIILYYIIFIIVTIIYIYIYIYILISIVSCNIWYLYIYHDPIFT